MDAPAPRTAEDVLAVRPASDKPLAFVTRVVDGDTLRLRGGELIRLIGVDTPETKHPTKPVQRCGPEASAFTRTAVEKRWVELEPDREPRDKYGRWLAYAYRDPDRFFLNAEIVRQGAGRAYTRYPFRHRDWFVELERTAKLERRGIWGGRRGCEVPAPVMVLAVPGAGQPEISMPQPPAVTSEPPPASNAPAPERGDRPTPAEPPSAIAPAPSPAPVATAGRRPGCDIKGNIGSGGERIYHLPGGNHYGRTRIDEAKGERWFCSEDEAQQAGWRKARN